MKEYGMNEDYLKEFYDSRKKFNKCVTDFLGKDAFLHEISHNSSSSSNSGPPYDFLSKQKNTLHSQLTPYNQLFNDYSETDPLSKQTSPFQNKIQKKMPDHHLAYLERQKVELFDRIKEDILNFFQRNSIKYESFTNKDIVEKFIEEIREMNVMRNIKKSQELKKQEKREQSVRNGEIIVQIESDLSSFYNMEIEEIKHQFDNLKQKNLKLQQQLKNIQSSPLQSSQQQKQLDFLKKIAKIREQQISQLKQTNFKLQVKKKILEEKVEKYHKIVEMAKTLIDEFVDKIRKHEYWKNQYYVGSYQGRALQEKKNIEKISFKNRRFEFIRARSEEKDIRKSIIFGEIRKK